MVVLPQYHYLQLMLELLQVFVQGLQLLFQGVFKGNNRLHGQLLAVFFLPQRLQLQIILLAQELLEQLF